MTINRLAMALAAVAAITSPTGCSGTAMQLQDANERLTSYYAAKEQAVMDTTAAMEETAMASLRDLATEAGERAAAEGNPLNKISFYRVAATAAWQAEDPRVLEYTEAGKAACEDEWSRAPRDCGMLTFIADFAAVDETTRTFNALIEAPPVSADDATRVFEAYEESARAMLDDRGDLDGRVPVRLLAAFDTRIDEVICQQIGIGAIGMVAGAGATLDGACRLSNLRFRAAQEAVALRRCTGPIPTSMQDCP